MRLRDYDGALTEQTWLKSATADAEVYVPGWVCAQVFVSFHAREHHAWRYGNLWRMHTTRWKLSHRGWTPGRQLAAAATGWIGDVPCSLRIRWNSLTTRWLEHGETYRHGEVCMVKCKILWNLQCFLVQWKYFEYFHWIWTKFDHNKLYIYNLPTVILRNNMRLWDIVWTSFIPTFWVQWNTV